MTLLYFLTAILLAGGVVLLFRLDIPLRDLLRRRREREKKRSLYRQPGSLGRLTARLRVERDRLLHDSKLPRRLYHLAVALCAVAGFLAGRAVFRSPALSVAVGAVCTLVPVAYLSYRRSGVQTTRLERLNASMSALSNSYLMTHDFIATVRANVELLEYPEPFRDFLTYVTYLDSDVQSGLRRMENQVSNPYFSQWIDALILAQKDRELSYVTVTIVDSMRDVLVAQRESEAAMYAVWRDYLLTLILIFASPLVLKMLMADAYTILTTSLVGQLLLALLVGAVIFSLVAALRINRPLITTTNNSKTFDRR